MSPLPDTKSVHRRVALLLVAVTFFSFIYFYEGGGWNQNSRFDLLRAIVERHTLQIDAYHENTEDKAHFNGHYYSDKAPGVAFLAVPFAIAARPMMRIAGVDPESARGLVALSYVVSAGTVALPTALAGVCLLFLALRFGTDLNGAMFSALVMCVGTPIWAYASLFWAHALVGSCFVFAFSAAMKLRDGGAEFWWALAVGLSAGWATVTEYPAAPVSAAMAVFALAQVWSRGKSVRWKVVAGVSLGAAACLAVLLGYLHAAFGAFRPSYSYYDPNSFSFMQQQGYLGLTYPHPDRLLKLLFGCSRGLFFASPVMIVAPVGLWLSWKQEHVRWPAMLAGSIAAYYFLFNASFYWWKAGQTFGPRYAGACIPLLCLGLAIAWQRASKRWRYGLIALAGCSVFLALMVVSTSSQLSMQDSCPIVHSVWPSFWSGHMATNAESILTPTEANGAHGAFNLGLLLGLRGLASLIPLFGAWIAAGMVWWRLHLQARLIDVHAAARVR